MSRNAAGGVGPAQVTNWVHNGQGHGDLAVNMVNARMDPGWKRPYIDKNGNPAVTLRTGRTTLVKGVQVPIREHVPISRLIANGQFDPVFNATSLRKEEWVILDTKVLLASRYRLRFWADLSAASSYGGFNGMAKTILEHETMTDPGEALVDMDGLSQGRTDSPQFQLQGVPLPITHSDFWFSSRRLAESRNSGTALDTRMGEAAGRRVAESIEKVAIGTNTGITYGGSSTQTGGYGRNSTVYGMTNFTPRLTYTSVVAATAGGYTPSKTLANVLAMRDLLRAGKFYGPYMLYTSNDWDQYMDNDYILTGGNVATQTLRNRLRSIEDITDVRRLDFLFSAAPAASKGPGGEGFTASGTSPFTLILIQLDSTVCQAVNGMDLTTIQWESLGGLRLNFKVMAICVPRFFADAYNNCGLVHGTTA